MASLSVEVVDTGTSIWSGEARFVSAPGINGQLGILPGHQSLLSLLVAGTVRVERADGTVLHTTISGGFLTVDSDQVTVAADSGEALVEG